MTLRAFFDKGVYKSTLKRFYLGSVLYFLLLFLCTGMVFLLTYDPKLSFSVANLRGYMGHSLLLREEFVLPGMAISMFVPTVVALLVYRFIHSKRAAVFTHSLPVTKRANYISTLAASFTLMAAPVILNAIVLGIISLTGYSVYFGLGDCVVWALFNLLVLFIMFSVSVFAAMCTGNSFALVALNWIFLLAPMLLASVIDSILAEFLFGFSHSGSVLNFVDKIHPISHITRIFNSITGWGDGAGWAEILIYIIAATVMYFLGYLLYKNRKTETSEDVAGFRVLNPVFKYFITFGGTLAVFSSFKNSVAKSTIFFVFVVVLSSVVFYFGSEMILKKTLKVWNTYKGYLAFGVVFSAFILFISLTSVFGYETYVPKAENIESAAIYEYYRYDKPLIENEKLSGYITEVHSELVSDENISILNHNEYNDTRIHIEYKLKNGNTVVRQYGVSRNKCDEIMSELYNYKEYRHVIEPIFDKRVKNVFSVTIDSVGIYTTESLLNELFRCMKEDYENLSYENLYSSPRFYCEVFYAIEEEATGINKAILNEEEEFFDTIGFSITPHCEKTIEWLENNGYDTLAAQIKGTAVEIVDIEGEKNVFKVETIGVIYCYDDSDIECEITDKEDLEALMNIFKSKKAFFTETPSCSFSDDIAIKLGEGLSLLPACDGCGIFKWKDTDLYISVSDEEREAFDRIVEKYGMVFPCI